MDEHDALCPRAVNPRPVGTNCYCHLIRRVRADEHERIEAGARALAVDHGAASVNEWHRQTAESVLGGAEPMIRADERERIGAEALLASIARDTYLRAKVEALRTNDTRLRVYDQAVDDVLALLGEAER